MKKLIYSVLFIIPLAGCELSGIVVDKDSSVLEKSFESTDMKGQEETYKAAEIFSQKTVSAEWQAIKKGYEPEIGVEKRAELLKYYQKWSEDDVYMAVGFVAPIDDFPKPVCPPRPRGDCKYPRVELAGLTFLVYCENPKAIKAQIETKEGTLAVLGDIEYDKKYREAAISFKVVNPDLLGQPAFIKVNTLATIDGKPQEVVMGAGVAEGIFY